MTVLLAEDDTAVRTLAAISLHEEQCDVLQASNGEEALHLARSHKDIDLLLTDVDMGEGLNGIELGLRIREERPGLRVLVMSGFPDTERMAAEKGMPFLAKPFTPVTLRQRVRDLLTANLQRKEEPENFGFG
jgi:DNA-binding response OmpR family regulator